jgi:hypothetical protein
MRTGRTYGRIMVLRKRGPARGSTIQHVGQRCVALPEAPGARVQFVSRLHGPLLYLLGAGTEHMSNRHTSTRTLARNHGDSKGGLSQRVVRSGAVSVQGQMTFLPSALVLAGSCMRRPNGDGRGKGLQVARDCTEGGRLSSSAVQQRRGSLRGPARGHFWATPWRRSLAVFAGRVALGGNAEEMQKIEQPSIHSCGGGRGRDDGP